MIQQLNNTYNQKTPRGNIIQFLRKKPDVYAIHQTIESSTDYNCIFNIFQERRPELMSVQDMMQELIDQRRKIMSRKLTAVNILKF